jgi:hypothetical protein
MSDGVSQPEGKVIFACQRCGGDLPPMDGELARLAQTTGGVSLTHEVCPGDEPAPADEGRYFEVRVQIVEVTEPPGDDPVIPAYANGSPDQNARRDAIVTELVSFKAGHRAADLDAAMRPLALALGEKWQAAEKQARIADAENLPQPRPATSD